MIHAYAYVCSGTVTAESEDVDQALPLKAATLLDARGHHSIYVRSHVLRNSVLAQAICPLSNSGLPTQRNFNRSGLPTQHYYHVLATNSPLGCID